MIIHLIITEKTHQQVLLTLENEKWTLPYLKVDLPEDFDLMNTQFFRDMAREIIPTDFIIPYALNLPSTNFSAIIVVLELIQSAEKKLLKGQWFNQLELGQLDAKNENLDSIVRSWFKQQAINLPLTHPAPWISPEWFEMASRWLESQLSKSGFKQLSALQQVKAYYTGMTFFVTTTAGRLFFKACSPIFIREIAITMALATWNQKFIPKPLFVNKENHWMVTPEIEGKSLLEIKNPEIWKKTITVYANLQKAFIPEMDRFQEYYLYDWRIEAVKQKIDWLISEISQLQEGFPDGLTEQELQLFKSKKTHFKDLCDQIKSYSVPCTLEHGDVHAKNIRILKDQPIFLDWAWSCITHPFVGAINLIRSAKRNKVFSNPEYKLKISYLQEWNEYETSERLNNLYALVQQWITLLNAVMDAEWVKTYEKALKGIELVKNSFFEWSLRKRQYYMIRVMKRLLTT